MGELRQDTETLNILVTGFGVFRGFEAENPSFKIAKKLPASIRGSSNNQIQANLTIYPEPVKVSYKAVDELTTELYSSSVGSPYDIILHIGVAGSIHGFQVEQRARRDNFPLKDVDDELPSQSTLDALEVFPAELESSANLQDVLERWKRQVPTATLCVSTDAGQYLCEYIYYNSLARTIQWRGSITAVFLHVPSHLDSNAIDHGRDVAVGLLRAIIDSNESAKQQPLSV